MRLLTPILLCSALLQACATRPFPVRAAGPVAEVDPLIGTGTSTTESARRHSESASEAKGQTFPAVGVPFGMTQLTPQTRDGAAKCVSPYYHFDERIQGFRASHWISGSCTQDYGSFTLMPLSGELVAMFEARASRFSHDDEVATPAYYAVTLSDEGIRAEATGSTRAGMLRFTFSRTDSAYILVNPNSLQGLGYVEVIPEAREIVGYNPVYRLYAGQGKPAGFSGYFVARFDAPIEAYGSWRNGEVRAGVASARGDSASVGAYVRLTVAAGGAVRVRIGTSFTSLEEARRNLDAEIPDSLVAVLAEAGRHYLPWVARATVEGSAPVAFGDGVGATIATTPFLDDARGIMLARYVEARSPRLDHVLERAGILPWYADYVDQATSVPDPVPLPRPADNRPYPAGAQAL